MSNNRPNINNNSRTNIQATPIRTGTDYTGGRQKMKHVWESIKHKSEHIDIKSIDEFYRRASAAQMTVPKNMYR